MAEHLSEWDHKWHDHNMDSKIFTLKTEVFNAKNDLITMSSNISSLATSISSFEIQNKKLINRIDTLSTEISLLQLQALGKITPQEMLNILKMLQSEDEENHVIAHETIKQLLKTI